MTTNDQFVRLVASFTQCIHLENGKVVVNYINENAHIPETLFDEFNLDPERIVSLLAILQAIGKMQIKLTYSK